MSAFVYLRLVAAARRHSVKCRQRVIDGMVLRLARWVKLVPPHEVHHHGHLPLAVGLRQGNCSRPPDRSIMAPKRPSSRNLHLVQAEAVVDPLPFK